MEITIVMVSPIAGNGNPNNGSSSSRPTSERRENVVRVFNSGAMVGPDRVEPVYDEHMAKHYAIMYRILESIKAELVPDHVKASLKGKRPFRFLSTGPGTGKLELFLFAQTLEAYLRNGGAVDVVLLDPSDESLSVAVRRFQNSVLPLPDDARGRFNIYPVVGFLEDIRVPDTLRWHPNFKEHLPPIEEVLQEGSFDLALASYLVNWVGEEARKAYENIYRLLAITRRLLVMEEHPLIVSPSASVPEGLEEAVRAMQPAVKPADFYAMLKEIGFTPASRLDLGRRIHPGTEYEHTVSYAILQRQNGADHLE